MVASNEQGGWKVLCQSVQPGHVEEIRDRFLTSNGQAPAGSKGTEYMLDAVSSNSGLSLVVQFYSGRSQLYLHNDQIGCFGIFLKQLIQSHLEVGL